MRILHLIAAGDEACWTRLGHLAVAQHAEGLNATVVKVGTQGLSEARESPVAALVAAGVPLQVVDDGHPPGTGGGLGKFDTLGWWDVIHAHDIESTRIALRLAVCRGRLTPVLQTVSDHDVSWAALAAEGTRSAVTAGDQIVVGSGSARIRLIAWGASPHRVSVVPDGVPELGERPRAEGDPLSVELLRWRLRGGDVLCVIEEDGQWEKLLDACASLVGQESLFCVLVGSGELDEVAAHWRHRLNGPIAVCDNRAAARPVTTAADYVLVSSCGATDTLAIAAAWADGVPVACSRTPGLLELTANGQAAVLFEPSRVEEITRAVTTLRRAAPGANRRLVERARRQYVETCSLDRMVDGYRASYEALIARARTAA